VPDYGTYRATRYFRALDGLRAVSILLVLAFHVNTDLWTSLHGWLGVQVFFVISGFLITTLLLREEATTGRVSLRGFYIRRTCRIFPLYYVTLLAYVVLYLVLKFRHDGPALRDALPYYATYFNDFVHWARRTPFEQSWSLGVEEKYYLVWPVLAFVLWRARSHWRLAGALALAALPIPLWAIGHQLSHYPPYGNILVGCVLALVLHDERLFAYARVLARPTLGVVSLAGAVTLLVLAGGAPVAGSIFFPWAVAAAMVPWLLTDQPLARLLQTRPMVYIGTRAYGIYLIHLLVLLFLGTAVRHAVPQIRYDEVGHPLGAAVYPVTVFIFVVGLALTLAGAELMNRTIEAPFIALGRRLTRRFTGREPIAPDRMRQDAEEVQAMPKLQPAS
jgi:peptidoglycan/LPS O-acetylase OafA/YrhL